MMVWLGLCYSSSSQCSVPAQFLGTRLGWWIIHAVTVTDVLSRIIEFVVTGFTTQSLYYPQISHIKNYFKITAAVIHLHVSFFLFLDWVCHRGVCRQNKKKENANKCKWTMWSALNGGRTLTDTVYSERAATQLCSAPWGACCTGSVEVRSQPKGFKPKMRERKLRSGVNCQWRVSKKGLKQTSVKHGLHVVLNLAGSSPVSQNLPRVFTLFICYQFLSLLSCFFPLLLFLRLLLSTP
jgi:hypothetical protein